MIRLFGFLTMATIAIGGFLFIDYRMAVQLGARAGDDSLTVGEYLSGLSDRVVELTSASAAGRSATNLAAMLPEAPEGWTARPVAAEDVDAFLPKSDRKADETAVALIKEMALPEASDGAYVATLAYEKGDRTLLIRALRYPDAIFTDPSSLDQRVKLQSSGPAFRGTEFMTVRGLDVTEDLLPKDFRGRMFLADVGGQIHIRVLAPKRMKDAELVAFFQTLDVPAMNASVVDKVDGLGNAPVIIIASALQDTDRDAYDAAVAARKAQKTQRHEAARQATEATLQEAAARTQATTPNGGSMIGNMLGSLFGKETGPMSEAERLDHQTALVEAARSGDAAATAANAAALYGAIAEELGKTETKGAAFGTSGSASAKSTPGVGIGTCKTEGGKKVCSVGGSD